MIKIKYSYITKIRHSQQYYISSKNNMLYLFVNNVLLTNALCTLYILICFIESMKYIKIYSVQFLNIKKIPT